MRLIGKLLIAVVLLPAMFGGCRNFEGSPAGKEALAAVSRYNGLLRRAYLEANPDLLASVATENQIRRVVPVIEALRASQSSMITEIGRFKVEGTDIEGDEAWVTTVEDWTYWWQHAATGQITKPRESTTYRLRYRLHREGDLWKVDGIQPVQ